MTLTQTPKLLHPALHSSPGWDCHVHVFDAAARVVAGHYTPPTHTLADIEARAAAHGVRHLVLVQPSVYGTDNSVLLQKLKQGGGKHRGVVVLGADVALATLEAMHATGVRGVRLNLVSPVGEPSWPEDALAHLTPLLQAMGWHAQWYARPEHLPLIAKWQMQSAVPCVLDHLAGMHVALVDDHRAWAALNDLALGGAWMKLSAWYRLGSSAPFGDVQPRVQRMAALFGERLLWGSDWPHTSMAKSEWPDYAALWAPVLDALGERATTALCSAPSQLYA